MPDGDDHPQVPLPLDDSRSQANVLPWPGFMHLLADGGTVTFQLINGHHVDLVGPARLTRCQDGKIWLEARDEEVCQLHWIPLDTIVFCFQS